MKNNMRSYAHVLKNILWNPYRTVFLLAGTVCFGVIAILISNYTLVLTVLSLPALPLAKKVIFLGTLFSDPIGTYGFQNIGFFLVIGFLFILNILILQRLFQEKLFMRKRSVLLNAGALFAAIVGLGCFSCGSVLLFFFLSIVGVTSSSTFGSLWRGADTWVLVLSILLFVVSVGTSLKKLAAPSVC